MDSNESLMMMASHVCGLNSYLSLKKKSKHLLGIVYEVVFIVKMKDNKDQCNIWNHSVTLNIILPHSKTLAPRKFKRQTFRRMDCDPDG